MTIQLTDYIVSLQGRQYLPVAPRIAAMRDEHPDWSIVTEVVPGGELVRATVADGEGRILATAHKTVTAFRGGAVEKAETGAVGRALALAGYGTLQALELDEGDEIADAPVERAPKPAARPAPTTPAQADGWTARVATAAGDVRALGELWREIGREGAEPNAHRRAYAEAMIATAYVEAMTPMAEAGLSDKQRAYALGALGEMGVTLADAAQPEKARAKLNAAASRVSALLDYIESMPAARPAEVA